MEFKTIIEPFKIKTVEPIRWTNRQQREGVRIADFVRQIRNPQFYGRSSRRRV
jgi:hypothetical protein